MRVAWVQDAEKIGGAELSNKTIVQMGRRLGHEITFVIPQDFKLGVLLNADVIILNGCFAFTHSQLQSLNFVLYEIGVPYVRYEHDHREVTDSTMRKLALRPFIGYPRRLFTRSVLNVFISPLHWEQHEKILGEDIRRHPTFLLPPAVDPLHFREVKEMKREEKVVVNTTGQLIQRKGLMDVAAFARANPDMVVKVYTTLKWTNITGFLNGIPNIKVFEPVKYEDLPAVYSRASSVIHFPEFYEDCGRTPIEGALCGCQVISNRATGAMSFDFWERFGGIKWMEDKCIARIEDRSGFEDYLLQGQAAFWREVESVL